MFFSIQKEDDVFSKKEIKPNQKVGIYGPTNTRHFINLTTINEPNVPHIILKTQEFVDQNSSKMIEEFLGFNYEKSAVVNVIYPVNEWYCITNKEKRIVGNTETEANLDVNIISHSRKEPKNLTELDLLCHSIYEAIENNHQFLFMQHIKSLESCSPLHLYYKGVFCFKNNDLKQAVYFLSNYFEFVKNDNLYRRYFAFFIIFQYLCDIQQYAEAINFLKLNLNEFKLYQPFEEILEKLPGDVKDFVVS